MSFLDNVLSGVARELKTLTGTVSIASSPAPTAGQVLTALDDTHAQWEDPTGGGGGGGAADALATTGGDVDVSGAAPPAPGQILTADDDTAASWVDPSWLPLSFFSTSNTVAVAIDGDGGPGPVAVVMSPNTVLMRAATGDVFGGTAADLTALLGPVTGTDSTARAAAAAAQATADAAVPKALYDANTILAATADNTPAPVTMGPSTVLTRLASGAIKAGSVAELQALLSISVSGGGAITSFTWASNAATLSLLTSKNWAASNALAGNSTLTITNGVDGDYGTIYLKQDTGTAGRTLTLSVAGRTVLRDANSADDNPQGPTATITAYNYQFVTIAGTPYMRFTKVFLS